MDANDKNKFKYFVKKKELNTWFKNIFLNIFVFIACLI